MPLRNSVPPCVGLGSQIHLVKFLTVLTYSRSPLAHIVCKEKCITSSGQMKLCQGRWLCKQNMGWTLASLAPLGWHTCAVNNLHNTMQQPYSHLHKVPISLEHMLCFVIFLPLFMCFPSSELETGQNYGNYGNCFEINPPNNPKS